MRTLLDKQIAAVDKLQRLKVGALFMEPGTGKTQVAVELINSAEADYVLYIAPYRVIHHPVECESIKAEIVKSGGFRAPVEFVGAETLSASNRTYLDLCERLDKYHNLAIICDESLKIKNPDAIRTRRIISLGKKAEYRIILNGTPIARNLLDLWTQMEFLSPSVLKMSYTKFKRTFCEFTTLTKRQGTRTIIKEWINKYHNVDYLYSLISPYVYECALNTGVDKSYVDIPFSVDPIMKAEYYRLKNEYLDDEKLEFLNNNIFIEMTQKMQHAYCLSSAKFDIVDKILNDNDPSKILIVCKYIDSREAVSDRFKNVTVLSYGMHSFGLNLQSYDTIIFWEKTFDFMLRDQIEHRIYRTGQRNTCRYFILNADVGLDRMLSENNDKKIKLLQYFKKVGAEQIKKEL